MELKQSTHPAKSRSARYIPCSESQTTEHFDIGLYMSAGIDNLTCSPSRVDINLRLLSYTPILI